MFSILLFIGFNMINKVYKNKININQMKNLEYKIGELEINPDKLRFDGPIPYYSSHKFVVELVNDIASIYVAEGERHMYIALKFGLDESHLVGGGSLYLDREGRLVLNDYSGDYGAIPKAVAKRFAELIIPELKKIGIEVDEIEVNPCESYINDFWKK